MQVGVPAAEAETRYPPTEFAGDAAASLPEITDGGLTYIIKLRPNVKYHPPLGRLMDSDDVLFAWKRLNGEITGADPSPARGTFAMVDRVEAPEARTVVFRLKRPFATLVNRLADDFALALMPKETGTAFDPTKTIVGSGPWIFKQLVPGVSVSFLRNPEWHLGPAKPYVDGIDYAVIPEYATRITQFLAGNLDSAGTIIPSDLKRVTQAYSGATIYGLLSGYSVGIAFSGVQAGPWTDPRVRQAVSLALDRDGLYEALYSPKDVAAAGLKAFDIKWHSHINVGFSQYARDPRKDSKLRPYFERNVAKAKALLTEAGYPDGFTVSYHYTKGYGALWTTHAELMMPMLADIGVKVEAKVEDFNSVYYPKTFTKGDFDGLAVFYFTQTEPGDLLEEVYKKGGSRNFGKIDDPTLTAEIDKIQSELDFKKRRQMILDIQDYLAEKMYYVPGIHDAGPSWNVWHPRVKDPDRYLTIRGGTGENQYANLWIA